MSQNTYYSTWKIGRWFNWILSRFDMSRAALATLPAHITKPAHWATFYSVLSISLRATFSNIILPLLPRANEKQIAKINMNEIKIKIQKKNEWRRAQNESRKPATWCHWWTITTPYEINLIIRYLINKHTHFVNAHSQAWARARAISFSVCRKKTSLCCYSMDQSHDADKISHSLSLSHSLFIQCV